MTGLVHDAAPAARGLDRRQLLFGGAMIVASAAALALTPRGSALALATGALEAAIPKSIGAYRFETTSGLVVPPQDEISARIYNQVLTRVYAAEGAPAIMLLIAYGSSQNSGLALHRPEICYPASGYSIGAARHLPIAGLPRADAHATTLPAEREGRTEQVYYWTRVGDAFPDDEFSQKIAVARANLAGVLPDGVLVRLSLLGRDAGPAVAALEAFNNALLASLGGEGRRLLLGPRGGAGAHG